MIFLQDTLRPVQRLSCVTTIIWTREAYFKLLTLSVSFFTSIVAIQFGWTRTSFGIVVSICYCYTSQVQHLNLEITIFCTVFIFSACKIQNGFILMEKKIPNAAGMCRNHVNWCSQIYKTGRNTCEETVCSWNRNLILAVSTVPPTTEKPLSTEEADVCH
jgi:hypothetical protein